MTVMSAAPSFLPTSIISYLVALADDQELDREARRALHLVLFSDAVAASDVAAEHLLGLLHAAVDCRRGLGSATEVERIAALVLRVACLSTLRGR